MRFYISIGSFNLKYIMYCILFFIIKIYLYLFIYYDNIDINIISNHKLLEPSCLFFGFFLNIIPEWISIERLNYYEYISIKNVIIIFFLSISLLFIRIIPQIINIDKDKKHVENAIEDNFILIEFLLIFLIPHSSEVYYKHQKLSFLIFTLIEVIKLIFFLIVKKEYNDILIIFLKIIFSIIYSFYFICIKRLTKYKFVSPYKFNFIVGIIDFPLIIIIYIVISFTSLGNEKNDNYIDNIFNLFKDDFNISNVIRLISLPLVYGLHVLLVIKIIYDFTLYHSFIPLLVEHYIKEIFLQIENEINAKIIFLFSCFFIELIVIFVFLEIIEFNFCGLNENLKRNIEVRADIESSLEIYDYYNNETSNKRKTIKNENN